MTIENSPADYLSPDRVLTREHWEAAYTHMQSTNLYVVVTVWHMAEEYIWREKIARGQDETWFNHHPINVMFANRVRQLTGAEPVMDYYAHGGEGLDPVSVAFDIQRRKAGQ